MTGSTCGVKGLFFCSMTACFSGMGATGCAISCSEMTTPEKSRWRDTASLRDSRSSMEPETVAAERPAATSRLEQISERQIIVVVPAQTGRDVIRPGLRCFESRENVGCELVHNVTRIAQAAANAVGHEIRGAIFFLVSLICVLKSACWEQGY